MPNYGKYYIGIRLLHVVKPFAAVYCNAVVAGKPFFPPGLDKIFTLPKQKFF